MRVSMYHPGSDRYQDASSDAFASTYRHEGWQLAEVADTGGTADTGGAEEPDGPGPRVRRRRAD